MRSPPARGARILATRAAIRGGIFSNTCHGRNPCLEPLAQPNQEHTAARKVHLPAASLMRNTCTALGSSYAKYSSPRNWMPPANTLGGA